MNESEKEIQSELDLLDNLIKNYYKQLEKNGDEKVKLGDFLKMIELRRKLSPENSEQKKFWKMINKIRHDNLKSEAKNNETKLQDKNEK